MEKIQVLILNASLKHERNGVSNTGEVADMVTAEMEKLAAISVVSVRLADKNIPVGVATQIGKDDDWPVILKKMLAADVVLFATPIWWGNRSSLMQRIIERMDAIDEGEVAGGREALLNKVAGVVITGSEDGAQAVMAGIIEVLSFLNFTIPPQCCTYWVGEVGMDPKTDAKRRHKNKAVKEMAQKTAKKLVYYAQLLKRFPQPRSK